MHYQTTLSTRPFMYLETKKVAQRLQDGQSLAEVRSAAIEQNFLQLPSRSRQLAAINVILKRLGTLDVYLVHQFLIADRETSNLILLYAIMASDQLFQEFMREVYLQRITGMETSLTKQDVLKFLAEKSTQSEKVARWTGATQNRLAAAYLQVLRDSGLMRAGQLVKGILAADVAQYLHQYGKQSLYEVLIGSRV
ncbi:hypothetical protein AYR54_03880 [Loigolactobacillus backii]|uniref:DUF1819 family protein n=1 Tax=Loigolactobacillus backii TaxID=375175 RepID=UPI0007F0D0AE|nr:DUF1819 family protein [Loigolactobacillus backii]ANK59457.1 hypothetical protein AYR52_03870 [Loigolactobacillus backii]ANK64450.1 hypothetical protein AYR54_03880 [Loigolactobacillus backii]ANK67154.1 hypothetical protein AYR55_05155 [Loigolactobacillus backii]OLF69501.1 hypothetical protein ACX53_07630 [Loigolactobacillus backii]PIO87799.1 hypothetical protein B8A32_11910 [Loigolactobacillus backii]